MIAARQIANRWYSQVAGVALVALGIMWTSVPAPTGMLCCLGGKAIQAVQKTEVGRELINMYAQRPIERRVSRSL